MNNQLQGIVLSIFSNLEKSGFKESKNSDVLPKLKSVVTEAISPVYMVLAGLY